LKKDDDDDDDDDFIECWVGFIETVILQIA
jgi:hypothetical protein